MLGHLVYNHSSSSSLRLTPSRMIKLIPKRFSRSRSRSSSSSKLVVSRCDIKWELRPGGMLVQKRDIQQNAADQVMITIRVSTVSQWHDVSVHPTSTFGEVKVVMSILTNMEAEEQRLVFKGKEREDEEHLHMVGVRDGDKMLLYGLPRTRSVLGSTAYWTISV